MAEILPRVVAEVKSYGTDCWLSYNHYTGYTREMMVKPPAFARQIPDDVICKWGVSWMLAPSYIKSSGVAPQETTDPSLCSRTSFFVLPSRWGNQPVVARSVVPQWRQRLYETFAVCTQHAIA